MSVNKLCNPPQESMNWSKELPTEYEYEFDPTDPDAPAAGNGLPVVRHNVYDCIELCEALVRPFARESLSGNPPYAPSVRPGVKLIKNEWVCCDETAASHNGINFRQRHCLSCHAGSHQTAGGGKE